MEIQTLAHPGVVWHAVHPIEILFRSGPGALAQKARARDAAEVDCKLQLSVL